MKHNNTSADSGAAGVGMQKADDEHTAWMVTFILSRIGRRARSL